MYILDCSEAVELCANLQPFLNIIKLFIKFLCWSIPILLLVLGTIDMFKAITKAGDEKAVTEARNTLIKRLIYGVLIFLVPFFVNIILEMVGDAIPGEDTITPTSWIACWNDEVDTSECSNIYDDEYSNVNENDD